MMFLDVGRTVGGDGLESRAALVRRQHLFEVEGQLAALYAAIRRLAISYGMTRPGNVRAPVGKWPFVDANWLTPSTICTPWRRTA